MLQKLWFLCLLVTAPEALGQGLLHDPKTALGAISAFQAAKDIYKHSQAFRRNYKLSRARACSRESGSLCASGRGGQEESQLLMATSPQAYDSRKAAEFSIVGPVKDQGRCSACMAFTVLAAAESAMAMALHQSASGDLSEQDFYFCKGVRPGFQSSCDEAWGLLEGVDRWIQLHDRGQYITTTACLPYEPSGEDTCSARCNDVMPALKSGSFKGTPLHTLPRMQEHIRNHGSIICRIDIYSDFRPMFQSQRNGVYRGPGKQAQAAGSLVTRLAMVYLCSLTL